MTKTVIRVGTLILLILFPLVLPNSLAQGRRQRRVSGPTIIGRPSFNGQWMDVRSRETVNINGIAGGYTARINGIAWTLSGAGNAINGKKMLALDEIRRLYPDLPDGVAIAASHRGVSASITLSLSRDGKLITATIVSPAIEKRLREGGEVMFGDEFPTSSVLSRITENIIEPGFPASEASDKSTTSWDTFESEVFNAKGGDCCRVDYDWNKTRQIFQEMKRQLDAGRKVIDGPDTIRAHDLILDMNFDTTEEFTQIDFDGRQQKGSGPSSQNVKLIDDSYVWWSHDLGAVDDQTYEKCYQTLKRTGPTTYAAHCVNSNGYQSSDLTLDIADGKFQAQITIKRNLTEPRYISTNISRFMGKVSFVTVGHKYKDSYADIFKDEIQQH